jgi:single-stranded-DNA-specific exonuclease
MKRWDIKCTIQDSKVTIEDIIEILLNNRGISDKDAFLFPPDPHSLPADDFGIDEQELEKSVRRILQAITNNESIIVYADYDADGITAGAILWETVHKLGGNVMPYIPHRVEEGYGLSRIGIDSVKRTYNADLIITVDHGITAFENVEYAKSLNIDVIVTDHHAKPEKLPLVPIVHTTKTSGAGVSWFLAKTLFSSCSQFVSGLREIMSDLLGLATVGIIADLLPLTGINRSLVSHGLLFLSQSTRPGVKALIKESGITQEKLTVYHVSHMLAPRLNALGRLDHALDALRLLCTKDGKKASVLAKRLSDVNKDRQQLTLDTAYHAIDRIRAEKQSKKILILADEMYNPGIIGLVAGKLVEEFYLPAIVFSKGEKISKASARSIPGFNIVNALREAKEFLLDVGGHPMAAGCSIKTEQIPAFEKFMEEYALSHLPDDLCVRTLSIDVELKLSALSLELFANLARLAPFGMGNPPPVFATRNLILLDARSVGGEGKHLKLKVAPKEGGYSVDAIAFGMANLLPEIEAKGVVHLAYTLEENEWNGKKRLQLTVKDIGF